jgi:hypothetical protein
MPGNKMRPLDDMKNYFTPAIESNQDRTHTGTNNYLKLMEDIKLSGAKKPDIVVFNIGSKLPDGEINYQEGPPFLDNLQGLNVEIFNIDLAYQHDPDQRRYAVKLEQINFFTLVCLCLKKLKVKVILFDNTCASGANFTHFVAMKLKKFIGSTLEILIGYGQHLQTLIPVLQLSKEFVENTRDERHSQADIAGFAANYCDSCQALYRGFYPISQRFAANNNLTIPEDKQFLVSSPDVQATLMRMANEKNITIYFTLDELRTAPLCSIACESVKQTVHSFK